MKIKFVVMELNVEFLVDDFPGIPHTGDSFMPHHMYGRNDEIQEILADNSYRGEVTWCKDEKGYSLLVFLTQEN